MGHSNAPLTPEGRRRLCERVDAGRAICHVAAEAGIARQTLGKWYERWITEGDRGLVDRSSRPECSPNQTAVHIEDRVEGLRRERKLGPVQLMGLLAAEGIEIAASTIYRVLVRRGISRLRDIDVSGKICVNPSSATSGPSPATWSTWTLRSRADPRRAAAGGSAAADRPSTGPRGGPRTAAPGPVSSFCTPPWTITPDLPTPKSCSTSGAAPRRGSGPGR